MCIYSKPHGRGETPGSHQTGAFAPDDVVKDRVLSGRVVRRMATCRADRVAGAVEHLEAWSTEARVAVSDKAVFEAVSKLACILYRDCKGQLGHGKEVS